VVNLWGYTLDFGDYYWKFSLLGGLLNLINFIATSLDLIYIGPIANLLPLPSHLLTSVGLSDGYEEFASHDIVSITTITMHVLSLLVFTLILLVYGIHIKQRLSQSYGRQTMDENDIKRKLAIILRINSVLNICCLCYLIRVILLCWVIYDTIQYESDSGGVTGHIPLILWFVLTGWIPTVGPVPICLPLSLLNSLSLCLSLSLSLSLSVSLSLSLSLSVSLCLSLCLSLSLSRQSLIFLYIMKTTTVKKPRPDETAANIQSTNPSQHEGESSRYSWYYEEHTDEPSQDRQISISRFASVEVEGLVMNIGLLRPDSIDQ
jgi:hypothetical protein